MGPPRTTLKNDTTVVLYDMKPENFRNWLRGLRAHIRCKNAKLAHFAFDGPDVRTSTAALAIAAQMTTPRPTTPTENQQTFVPATTENFTEDYVTISNHSKS